MEWQQVENNFVLAPSQPKGVIHFLGGAFFAAAPHISYSRILETLARAGYVIVATPIINSTFDHRQIAIDAYKSFKRTRSKLFLDYFPLFGMGHSMGCKIHLLINSFYPSERAGNIFIAYNNYGAKQSIPLFKEFAGTIPEMENMEFTPSPLETMELINQSYTVENNLLIKFVDDDIDEIAVLASQLQRKFNNNLHQKVTVKTLPGTHLTSMGMDLKWQAGQSFTPVDAVFQWIKQGMHKDNSTLEQTILSWLKSHPAYAKTA
ncbi:Protein of unknown function (DUF1350) [Synechococcus sp. PCC 7502]|uniref:DUF1350 family protein n=1 Tax=Synechococcus sp. PCC 7502 TaxID=1173263 RepID=UPI00029FCD82|nr:DUF1350 family protein [Synechococcus sp. PCC 7502]AFY74947.1 Protein of unknown function (DUF1350) [Synechococcus sp. PCC 7502]